MSADDVTCWDLIRRARDGKELDRNEFARRYFPAVRAYLSARWRSTAWKQEIDDTAQEVFIECFRESGALENVDETQNGGFRAFLYGVTRNVARRTESARINARERQAPMELALDQVDRDETRLSQAFDRAWARSRLAEAFQLQTEWASGSDEDAARRVELLRLRFEENMPIREIATAWDADASVLHEQYRRARREFKSALRSIVTLNQSTIPQDIEKECDWLLDLLR